MEQLMSSSQSTIINESEVIIALIEFEAVLLALFERSIIPGNILKTINIALGSLAEDISEHKFLMEDDVETECKFGSSVNELDKSTESWERYTSMTAAEHERITKYVTEIRPITLSLLSSYVRRKIATARKDFQLYSATISGIQNEMTTVRLECEAQEKRLNQLESACTEANHILKSFSVDFDDPYTPGLEYVKEDDKHPSIIIVLNHQFEQKIKTLRYQKDLYASAIAKSTEPSHADGKINRSMLLEIQKELVDQKNSVQRRIDQLKRDICEQKKICKDASADNEEEVELLTKNNTLINEIENAKCKLARRCCNNEVLQNELEIYESMRT